MANPPALKVSASSLITVNGQVLTLPTALRERITSAIYTSPGSINHIQEAFSTALTSSGLNTQLQQYIFEVLRQDSDSVPSNIDVLEMVLQQVRESVSRIQAEKGGSRDSGAKGLQVPDAFLKKGQQAVRRELERVNVQVEDDEEDWT